MVKGLDPLTTPTRFYAIDYLDPRQHIVVGNARERRAAVAVDNDVTLRPVHLEVSRPHGCDEGTPMIYTDRIAQDDRLTIGEPKLGSILTTDEDRIAGRPSNRVGLLMDHAIELLPAAGCYPKHAGSALIVWQGRRTKMSFAITGGGRPNLRRDAAHHTETGRLPAPDIEYHHNLG